MTLPDSEVNLHVAEEVMHFERSLIRNGTCRVVRRLINNWHDDEEEWNPAWNIAHAMEILTSKEASRWDEATLHQCVDGTWLVTLSRCKGSLSSEIVAQETAETLPMCLCLAALKAVGGEGGNDQ